MYSICLYIWPILSLLLDSFHYTKGDLEEDNKKKIVRNILSATHSIICTFSFLLAYYTQADILRYYAICFSSSYFIWDSYFIIVNKFKADYVFLIHHGITIYVLEYVIDGYNKELMTLLIVYGELSNFPHYLVYHKLKRKNSTDLNIRYWRHIQITWFVFFRWILYGQYITSLYTLFYDWILILSCYCLYFMGVYWGIGQLKGINNDYYSKTNKIH